VQNPDDQSSTLDAAFTYVEPTPLPAPVMIATLSVSLPADTTAPSVQYSVL
jgi:hypothetical protein